MKKKEGKKIGVTYVGKRIRGDKVFQTFTYGQKVMSFTGVKYVSIGYKYEATQLDDGHIQIQRTPEQIPNSYVEDTAKIDEWEMEDEIAASFMRRKRASARANGIMKKMEIELAPIRKRYRGLKGLEEIRAFESLVLRLLNTRD